MYAFLVHIGDSITTTTANTDYLNNSIRICRNI